MTDKKPVEVVEQYDSDPVRGAAEGIIVGENGKIWMQGKVLGGFMVAGQPACIELQVKNHSSKKVNYPRFASTARLVAQPLRRILAWLLP